jgi:hypothetical protein
MRRPVHEIAAEVLRETDNPAVMWGDAGLLDMIHARAFPERQTAWPSDRWKRVLDALDRNPGPFTKSLSEMPGGRCFRKFTLR